MVHLAVKKVGRIPDGNGWRIHGQHKSLDRAKRLPRETWLPLPTLDHLQILTTGLHRATLRAERATAAAFLAWAKVWFAAHGITPIPRVVTNNRACYRSGDLARIVSNQTRHQRTKSFTPKHNGKVCALSAHPGRGGCLRPRVQLRGRMPSRDQRLEHPLQLPSTP
jgi:hypothetical protein